MGSRLVRATILRLILEYWRRHGADWMPHEAMIKQYLDKHGPVIDKRTLAHILDALVRTGMLRRTRTRKHQQYQLVRRYADPNWAGFAPTIDDLLHDPITWVEADGSFLRVGARQNSGSRIYEIPTFPHYFVQHTWTRAWIHALNLGLFSRPADALQLAREAAREAPLHLLWTLHNGSSNDPGVRTLMRLFEGNRVYQTTRGLSESEHWPAMPKSPRGKWLGSWAEAAMRMLHQACGHLQGDPWQIHRLEPDEILDGETVYSMLDAAVRDRLLKKRQALEPEYREKCEEFFENTLDVAWVYCIWQEWQDEGKAMDDHPAMERIRTPPMELLEPLIRAMPPRLRATRTMHRWAWPIAFYAADEDAAAESISAASPLSRYVQGHWRPPEKV